MVLRRGGKHHLAVVALIVVHIAIAPERNVGSGYANLAHGNRAIGVVLNIDGEQRTKVGERQFLTPAISSHGGIDHLSTRGVFLVGLDLWDRKINPTVGERGDYLVRIHSPVRRSLGHIQYRVTSRIPQKDKTVVDIDRVVRGPARCAVVQIHLGFVAEIGYLCTERDGTVLLAPRHNLRN